jgi:hypothetical protein
MSSLHEGPSPGHATAAVFMKYSDKGARLSSSQGSSTVYEDRPKSTRMFVARLEDCQLARICTRQRRNSFRRTSSTVAFRWWLAGYEWLCYARLDRRVHYW